MDNLPPGAENDPRAPWNENTEQPFCEECQVLMEPIRQYGKYTLFECPECLKRESNEPYEE